MLEHWHNGTPSTYHFDVLRDAVSLVPEERPVAATNRAGSHLSARQYFFSIPKFAEAEWVVIDLKDPWVPLPPRTRDRPTWGRFDPRLLRGVKRRPERSPQWQKVFERSGVAVFRRIPGGA